MKKFFSILCAITIVFSANAAQVSKKDVLAGNVAKKEIHSKHATTHVAKSATFKSFEAKAPVAKLAPKTHLTAGKTVVGVEKKALKTVAFKAPQAKKEAIDLTFSSAAGDDVDWSDNCADAGWWQIEAENDEAYVSISNLDREIAAGEYAWEDLDPDFCGFWVDGMEAVESFADGHCTVTVDDADLLKVTVIGEFKDAEGFTYNVNVVYEEEELIVGDIDFVAVKESHNFYATDNDVYFTFRDAEDNVLHFDIVAAEGDSDIVVDKEYTLEDMIASYSNVTYQDVRSTFAEVSFKKTIEGKAEKYTGLATDTLGRTFHLSYEFSAPEAEKFETITADAKISKELYLFWYVYTFEGADEANAIELSIMPDESYYGVWEAGKDITGAVTPLNGIESEIYSGEVTIAPTADGCTITGKVLCYNNTEYTLNLTYKIPDPTREEVLIIEGLELEVYDEIGAWQLLGYNEDSTKFVSIAAYIDTITNSISGNYTTADLLADYSYVVTDIEGSSYNQFELLNADLSVQFTEEDSTIVIAGNFLGQNGEDVPLFTVLLKGKIPATEVSDMTFQFTVDDEGITVTPSNNEDAWDWYIASEDMFEYYGGAEGLAEAIYDYYGNAYAITGELFLPWDGEDISYYCQESGVYYLVVWGSGARNITTPAASQKFEVEGSGSPYDADEAFNGSFAEYEVDDRYLASYGVLFIDALNENNEYVSIELWLPEGASDLVAGEYAVSAEEMVPQTVTATELDLTEGQIYGSFAGVLSSQGIQVPFWFFADGKVVVNADGSIDVDALNTKGVAVKAHLAERAQGIENVVLTEDAKKIVVDGVLYIVRDNKLFNVLGTQVR